MFTQRQVGYTNAVAIAKLKPDENFYVAEIGKLKVRENDWLYSISTPLGPDNWSVVADIG